jgi:hypothetical protein
LRIFKNVAVFVSRAAQHLGSELRRDLDSGHRSIFRDVANFVDLDGAFTGERRFQLLGELAGLVVSAGEGAHESREVALRGIGRKMNAGDSRTSEKLRETFFSCGGTERHAVQHDLVARCSQQQSRVSTLIQGRA